MSKHRRVHNVRWTTVRSVLLLMGIGCVAVGVIIGAMALTKWMAGA